MVFSERPSSRPSTCASRRASVSSVRSSPHASGDRRSGTGIIISTAFVHLLYHSFIMCTPFLSCLAYLVETDPSRWQLVTLASASSISSQPLPRSLWVRFASVLHTQAIEDTDNSGHCSRNVRLAKLSRRTVVFADCTRNRSYVVFTVDYCVMRWLKSRGDHRAAANANAYADGIHPDEIDSPAPSTFVCLLAGRDDLLLTEHIATALPRRAPLTWVIRMGQRLTSTRTSRRRKPTST